MRQKLLLIQLFFMVSLPAFAQNDTIKTLIISEAHLGDIRSNYVEITNMGTEAVDLGNFELGRTVSNDYLGRDFMFPSGTILQPGKSYFIGLYRDFEPTRAKFLGMEGYTEEPQTEFEIAQDYQVHTSDYDFANDPMGIGKAWIPYDSIGTNDPPISMYFGRECIYLEQHFPSGDSAVVDQVMGVFDVDDDGDGILSNKGMGQPVDGYDVAGYMNAGSFANLIRRYSVKEGNLEFVRGNSENDSEWIAIENLNDYKLRKAPWTFGNHGDYNLDENTLVPKAGSGITVDYPNKIITVPWGTLRPDGIMAEMEYKPGVAWEYIYSRISTDSLTIGSRTGDSLLVIVVGEDADRAKFRIEVEAPTASENRLIPMMNEGDDYVTRYSEGFTNIMEISPLWAFGPLSWPWVIHYESDLDTITGFGTSIVNYGIPAVVRIDSLLERLEKPANAAWEFVPVDGNALRPDIVEGDIIKVISEDGSVREYYIKTSVDVGSANANLNSITWPDIPDPELFEFLYGWKGDTIPGFSPSSTKYQMKLPPEIQNIPATVAKPSDVNARIDVQRATFLQGTQEERTTIYTVTATDDTTIVEYSVEWQPEQDPQYLQPYSAEPFISEMISRENYPNHYLEICNPGNQDLDMSNYMIVAGYSNPADAIQFNPENWLQRYRKYIPGYKWVDQIAWTSNPGFVVRDIVVNPIVKGGDVFCLGEPSTNGIYGRFPGTDWSTDDWPGRMGGQFGQSDVTFYNNQWGNPWGEDVADGYTPIAEFNFAAQVQYIFKILNDSIQRGLKAATDPNDFELIEIVGEEDGSRSLFGYDAVFQGHSFTRFNRKPEVNTPNPVLGASFGTGDPVASGGYDDTSEWERIGRWNNGVGGWPKNVLYGSMMDYGKHYFIPSTKYKSTVNARIYKVTPGYSMNEQIRGLITGVTVNEFFNGLTKSDPDQTLVVKSSADGSELGMDNLIVKGDTLIVVSADLANTTKYILEVSEEGLNSNAVLTSILYTINVDVEPKSASEDNAESGSGTVSDFEYGTTLKTLLRNITVPSGASLSVIDKEGAFVPLRRLNFDTAYVEVIVNTNTLLEVIAEDGVTSIIYELAPSTSQNDAFITSDYFNVIQSARLVEFVPWGISVSNLLSKVAPSVGAALKIVDKSGLERTQGGIAIDDKIVVTSVSGNVTNVYHLSMLSTQSIPETTYLAYVLSNIYLVDQVNYVIAGPTATTLLSEFYSRITASMGATAVVVDAQGNERTSGDLNSGDKLKVTSADGKIGVMYALDLDLTSSDLVDTGQINLYPNPTSGKINITGLTSGGRIQVFNSMGAAIRDVNIQGNLETVSLDDQPAGMYLIVIRDKTKMVGRYKVIRR